MTWAEDFIAKHKDCKTKELKKDNDLVRADLNISRILREQKEKEKKLKVKSDLKKIFNRLERFK